MPRFQDYSQDEENQPNGSMGRGLAGGGAPAGSGASQATPQKAPEFTNWSRFTSANEDVSKREADKLAGGVQGDIDRTKSTLGEANDSFANAIESNYEHGPQNKKGFGVSAGSSFGAPQIGRRFPQAPTRAEMIRQGPKTVADAPTSTLGLAPVSNRSGLTANAIDHPASSKSLEDQMGAPAWGQFLGNASRAEAGAKALGSESGVQALLQQQSPSPNSAFDAALIGGAGRKQFGETSKAGEGLLQGIGEANMGAQDAWHRLMGDIHGAQRDRQFTAEADATNLANAAKARGANATTPTHEPWRPEGYTDLNSFLGSQTGSVGGVYQDVHAGSQALSPADWITRGLGEAGVDAPMASEAFSGYVAGDMAPKGQWQVSDVRTGMQQAMHEYGQEAVQWLWDNLNQATWDAWLKLSNPGSVARDIRAILEAHGFKKQATSHQTGSQGNQSGVSTANADAGTTAEEETARNNAYREGWGTQYDEQFRSGNRKPVKP